MIEEVDYQRILGDSGWDLLTKGKDLREELMGHFRDPGIGLFGIGWDLWRKNPKFEPARKILDDLGLCDGQYLRTLVKDFVVRRGGRYADLKMESDITFQHLRDCGAKPLKVVASDLRSRKAAVFSAIETHYGQSVAKAIGASTCYPFVFKPVTDGDNRLVDGGLSSNLPVFLFDEERRRDLRPMIAFDLIEQPREHEGPYRFGDFLGDLIATALSAGDSLLRASTSDIIHVPIPVPAGIDTLKFDLSKAEKEQLFFSGNHHAAKRLRKHFEQAREATTDAASIQAALVEPLLVEAVLKATIDEVERFTKGLGGEACRHVRAYVMLPADQEQQMVVYNWNMRDVSGADSDISWKIPLSKGPSGFVREQNQSRVFLPQEVRRKPESFGLTEAEAAAIPKGVENAPQTALCVPIHRYVRGVRSAGDNSSVVGTLTIDTRSTLEKCRWMDDNGDVDRELIALVRVWCDVIAKLLA